jgi:4-hydroxybenzoate polyprenyltransferase
MRYVSSLLTRLRPSLGITIGLLIFLISLQGNLDAKMIAVILGFGFIHLAGDIYNDITDIEEDKRNRRFEKMTLNGLFTSHDINLLAICSLLLGLILTLQAGAIWLILGIFYTCTLFLYSYKRVRLKARGVLGYFITFLPLFCCVYLLINLESSHYFSALVTYFSYCYVMYIMCQKDSTDTKDDTNIFLKRGWASASTFCNIFGVQVVVILAFICISKPILIIGWLVLTSSIIVNLLLINKREIDRPTRKRLVSIQFVTLYLLTFLSLIP